MRHTTPSHLCSVLLCGGWMLLAGCAKPAVESLQSLSITATPSTVSVGGAVVLQAVAHLSDGTTQNVTSATQWTLSDASLATVTNGVLTTKAAGSLNVQGAFIEVAAENSANTAAQTLNASAQVTITAAGTTTTTPALTWNTPAPIPAGTALSSAQLDAGASVPGAFVYLPAAGTVLPPGTQTLTTTFTPSDTKHYSAATASVQLSVTPSSPANPTASVITWNTPAPISNGTALSSLQLDATANVPGTFAYSPASGTVLPAGVQTLTTTFSPTDLTVSSIAHATVTVTVIATPTPPTNPAVSTLTWNTPAGITYGTLLTSAQLNATANVAGTFAYTPAAGTLLQAGTHTLSVTFTPTDSTDYSTATASVQLAVSQATPVLQWPAPAAIAQGTALGANQLDATASVAGTFTYKPAAGVIPQAGTLQLLATFSPTDATDYLSVTAQNSLLVTAPPNPAPTGCGGPTITLDSSMSESTIQSTISKAANCSLVVFSAGTYNLTSTLAVPCTSNITFTGPATSPATAIIAGTFANSNLFGLYGCTGVTVEYLGFNGGRPSAGGGSAIYIGSDSNNITISHNNFSGNQGGASNSGSMAEIFLDGNASNTDTNNVITWNTFGTQGDCSTVMTEQQDQGGLCSAVLAQNSNSHFTVESNTVTYQEEGFKILPQRYCGNCTFNNNHFDNIHRIAIELQVFTATGPLFVEHNDFYDFVNAYYSTMAISTPCCFDGTESPNSVVSDNVLIANFPAPNSPPAYIPYGIEFWGFGSLAQYNLVQGYWANGITWGEVNAETAVQYNILCGPDMASAGTYISNEEKYTPPILTPNTTSPTCSAQNSTAPTIAPASGSITAATTVTITESGMNHSIYYTTDGTAPTVSSTLYTGPFSVNPGTTVKAIGMWGQGANAKTYPAGYGYVPSSVVSQTYDNPNG